MSTFTAKAIKQTFMELLNKKPLNKITVKDIAEECGINRNSFYYHYNDIPSLLEEIFTEEAETLVTNQKESTTFYEQLLSAVDFAIENRAAVYHIYNSASREMFERYLEKISNKTVSSYISQVSRDYNISERDKSALVLYYKCLLIGFVIDWLSSDMKYDLRDQLRRICILFDGAMLGAIKKGSELNTKA